MKLLASKVINTWNLGNERRNTITYRCRLLEMKPAFIGHISSSRKESCKSVQKGTACLAFSCNFSHVPLAFTRYRMHILGAHVRHTPRGQSLLPVRLSFPFHSSPFSIMIGASPPSPARRAFYRPSNRRYTNSKFVHSISLLVFCPLSSFSLSLLSRGFVYFAVLLE